jgi:hypothetical protein
MVHGIRHGGKPVESDVRTLRKQTTLPERIVETTMYGCDLCDFMGDSEGAIRRHHGESHACRDTKEIGDQRFAWFDTEEDMASWADAVCYPRYQGWGGSESYRRCWQGAGWYRITGESRLCNRRIMVLTPVAGVVRDLKDSVAKHQARLEEFRKEFNLPSDEKEV